MYILASKGRKLYTGVTSELRQRVNQHKKKIDPNCHTARYNINMLIYYEVFDGMNEAIARESAVVVAFCRCNWRISRHYRQTTEILATPE